MSFDYNLPVLTEQIYTNCYGCTNPKIIERVETWSLVIFPIY